MSDSTTPQYHGQLTCPTCATPTQTASTHARAGALVFSSSCLDESITRVGPRSIPTVYPVLPYGLRLWVAHRPSTTAHHSTPPAQEIVRDG